MARPLDLRQQEELSQFVNALFDAAGFETTAEWARQSDYPAPNLSNLRNGKGGVDGYNLLRLIRAAAARSGQTAEEMALETAAESPESIRLYLAKLTAGVTRSLELLEELLEAQDDPPGRASEPTGRKRRAR